MRRQLALYVVMVAVFGSLYTQFVAGWSPCGICTLQRVFMYPLAVVIPLALLQDARFGRAVLPVSLIGAGVSLFHHVVIRIDPTRSCGFWLPCHMEHALGAGPVLVRPMYLPLLAAVAFILIAALWYSGGDT